MTTKRLMATARGVPFGGYDKGVVVEGVARAAKKADVGVPQVRPDKRPVKEAMLIVPGVKGWVEGGYSFSAIYAARKRKKRDEEEEEGEEGVMMAGGSGAVSNARRRRRRGGSENPLGAKINGVGATTPPQQL